MPPISAPPRGREKNASVTARRISSSTRAEYSMVNGHSGTLQVRVVLSVPPSAIWELPLFLIVGDPAAPNQRDRISRTLRARASRVKGLVRKSTLESRTPW